MFVRLPGLYRDADASEQGATATPTLDQELDAILEATPDDNQTPEPSTGPDENVAPAKDDQDQLPAASGPDLGKKETQTGTKDDNAKEKDDTALPSPEPDKVVKDSDELFADIDEKNVPESLKPLLEKVKSDYRKKWTEKTTGLANERKSLGALAKFSDRAGDLDTGLQIFDLIKKDPGDAIRFIQSLNGGAQPQPQSPAPVASDSPATPNSQDQRPNGDPLEAFYAKAESLNLSRDQVNLFLEMSNATSNSVMEPFAQNMYEQYIKPNQIEKENQGLAQLKAEVAEMEGNQKDYPYLQQLSPAILQALRSNPNLNSPKAIYAKIVSMTNLDKIVTDRELGLARNIENDNRDRNASLVNSPDTNTGSGPTPRHGSVDEAFDAFINSHGGFSQYSG